MFIHLNMHSALWLSHTKRSVTKWKLLVYSGIRFRFCYETHKHMSNLFSHIESTNFIDHSESIIRIYYRSIFSKLPFLSYTFSKFVPYIFRIEIIYSFGHSAKLILMYNFNWKLKYYEFVLSLSRAFTVRSRCIEVDVWIEL